MKTLSPVFVAIIAACAVMIGYLMLYVPYECQNLAIASGGTSTCGLEPGAYVIAAISGIVGIAAAVMLVREHGKNQES
jgi:hypothetical protein